MNIKSSPASQSSVAIPRALLAYALCAAEVLFFTFSFAATPADAASLSFEDRVDGQRAIEEVYRQHRTSTENTSAKPALAPRLSEAALREKVTDALRMSDALATLWNQAITGEQLQAEIDRMAVASKQPEMLRELWAALGNDPQRVAECLVRPLLAARLISNRYAGDPSFNAALRAKAHADRTQYASVGEMRQMSGTHQVTDFTRAASTETASRTQLSASQFDAMVQGLAGAFGAAARTLEAGQSLQRLTAVGSPSFEALPLGRLSDVREDVNHFSVVAVLAHDKDHLRLASVVWPKVSFDAWWSSVRDTLSLQIEEPRYAYQLRANSAENEASASPSAAGATSGLDQWRPIAGIDHRVLAPTVWTGSEMIVWAGANSYEFGLINPHRDGGRYDPATDTWRPMNVIGAPRFRILGVTMPKPVWTGKEMIVWGGFDPISGDNFNDGARYNPATDTWTPMTTVGAPVPRDSFAAVWTGTEMIVWGGWNGHDDFAPYFQNSGGRYNPETDTWTATNSLLAPEARQHHSAVWTGTKMIIWGGNGADPQGSSDLNNGGIYDPQTDSWSVTGTNLVGAPTDRYYQTAIWTGTEMIIWGGRGLSGPTGSGGYDSAGGRYNPSTDTWQPMSTVNVPGKRKWHFSVWSGTEMLVWGGDGPGPDNHLGGRYNPATDTWVTINQIGAPPLSYWLSGVWTGSEMLVFGGTGRNDGRYNPATDTWRSMNTPTISQQYQGPYGHSAVWTGSEMIIWGGRSGEGSTLQNKGGIYVPSTDTWRQTTTVNAPEPRYAHSAVWTGQEMIVWGGIGSATTGNSGARYNPETNVWTATSLTSSTPAKRGEHTAVWTGSEMIVWGGRTGATVYGNGGRYVPASDTWQLTSSTGTPSARYSHSAVWSGSKMIVWGGGSTTATATGGQYDPTTDAWLPTSTAGVPSARAGHTAIWSGSKMLVWGGGSYSGGRYDPVANSWQPMSTNGYSGGVIGNSAVWSGGEMLVWGGGNTNGGRYNPTTDLWQPMSVPSFLAARSEHTAVWTGDAMIVFGGYLMTTTGAAYIPPNQAPIARLTGTPTNGAAPLPVNFDASTSSDADAGDRIASYTFDFGDGSAVLTQSGSTTSHTYAAAGSYTATLTVTDSHSLQSANTAQLVISATQAVATADPFIFIERKDVPVKAFVTSEAVQLTGFTGSLPISIDGGGQYRINGDSFTSDAGNITSGSQLTVRHVSASTVNTSLISMVTVGSYSTPFKSTTTTEDRVPDAFSFGSQSGLNPGVVVESVAVTLTGFNTGTPIVAGPGVEYRVGNGSWTRANGRLGNVAGGTTASQTLQVRHTTNSSHLGYTKTYLRVGGVSGYFTSRTK